MVSLSHAVCALARKIASSSSSAPEALFSFFLGHYFWGDHQSIPEEALCLMSCLQRSDSNSLTQGSCCIPHVHIKYRYPSWGQTTPGEKSNLQDPGDKPWHCSVWGEILLISSSWNFCDFWIVLWNVTYMKTYGGCKTADAAPQAYGTQHECLCAHPQGTVTLAHTGTEWVWQTRKSSLK